MDLDGKMLSMGNKNVAFLGMRTVKRVVVKSVLSMWPRKTVKNFVTTEKIAKRVPFREKPSHTFFAGDENPNLARNTIQRYEWWNPSTSDHTFFQQKSSVATEPEPKVAQNNPDVAWFCRIVRTHWHQGENSHLPVYRWWIKVVMKQQICWGINSIAKSLS